MPEQFVEGLRGLLDEIDLPKNASSGEVADFLRPTVLSYIEQRRRDLLRDNDAEHRLAVLTSRVEQHLMAVGQTPHRMLARSEEAMRRIEKVLAQLKECAEGRGDYDLGVLVTQLEDELQPIQLRQKWHNQQIEAFAPLRRAIEAWHDGPKSD